MSELVDPQQQERTKLVVATLGIVLVSSQIKPLRRMACAFVGRIYVQILVLAAGGNKKKSLRSSKYGTDSDDDELKVAGLYIHPVKSFRPVSVKNATLDAKGFIDDRRFMLIMPLPLPSYKSAFDADEATHRFLSQRQCPSLATISARLDNDKLTLTCNNSDKVPGGGETSITISVEPDPTAPQYLATLWGDVVQVQDMGNAVATFCQAVVDKDKEMPDELKKGGVRLVMQARQDQRSTNAQYTPAAALSWWGQSPAVALTDGFPILLANQASLDELNRRLVAKGKKKIDMSRFRPNIVVTGSTTPFEEDHWKVISIDGVLFHIVKGCPRCKQSCTDQVTGQVYEEPLATLAEFRATTVRKEDLYFAQNVIAAMNSQGQTIRVGASVKVLQRGSPVWEE